MGLSPAHVVRLIIDIIVNHIAQLFAGNIWLQLKNFLFKQLGRLRCRLFLLYPVHSASLEVRETDGKTPLPSGPLAILEELFRIMS